jgi:hypothetical protein
MSIDALALPSPVHIRAHILEALNCYWSVDHTAVDFLPVDQKTLKEPINGPLKLIEIKLPLWAEDCGVDGYILVPHESVDIQHQGSEAWKNTDWWLAAFLLLECWHERVWEQENGPLHSYCFRLKDWDERAWQYAWVNRIGLFLCQWVLHQSCENVFGLKNPLPKTDICMTHDVDAISKTLPIRLKQGIFNLFNVFRCVRSGQFRSAKKHLIKSIRFMFGREDWWKFNQLLEIEKRANIKATFNFHADLKPKTIKRWLFDPSYDLTALSQKHLLQELHENGHSIGLHPGFETWNSSEKIAEQRKFLESITGTTVSSCRQHWLRFSWSDTWAAQQAAGIQKDSTLMFNDRPGFRNSSALIWHPWDVKQGKAMRLNAQSTVFMDSHFYDYQQLSSVERNSKIQCWLEECNKVNGTVAVLWHPHTLTEDYGWALGFHETVTAVQKFSR